MLEKLRKDRGEEGFTLIELLVVIIIIGILAAIAIPVFLNQRAKGWDAAVQSDLRNAATAQETYLTENNPGQYADGTTDNAAAVAALVAAGFKPSADGNYASIAGVPTFAMNVTANGGQSYCMTAQSQSSRYFGYDSTSGPVFSDTGITNAAGVCTPQ